MADNKGLIIGIVLVIALAMVAAFTGLGGGDDAPAEPVSGEGADGGVDETPADSVIGADVVSTVDVTVKDRDGALADTDNINMYVTTNTAFTSIYDAFEAKANDKIPNPFKEGVYINTPITISAEGVATLTLKAPVDGVRYYDILVFDTDVGTTDDYIDCIQTIGVMGLKSDDGTESLKIVNSDVTTVDEFKEIQLTKRADVSVISDEAEYTTYVRVLDANASETSKTKLFYVGTTDEYSSATDITVYVEEIADVSGTAEVYVNDVLINGVSVGFSEVTTSNFDSKSPVWKNKPVATGTLYAIEGVQEVAMGGADATADKVGFEVTVDYDVDVSAVGTTDNAQIKLHFVSFNGHVDTDQELESFTFDLDEDSAATPNYA